jgi:Holliday junction resolvasome RuvABC ATP-dependent DNA helicase subunit
MLTTIQHKRKERFANIIGQDKAKSTLNLLIDIYGSTYFLPHVLILGQFGGGKTSLALETAKALHDKENPNKIKRLVKLHGNTLQTEDDLFNNLVIPHLMGDASTVFIDEIHNIGNEVEEALLVILEIKDSTTTNYDYNGNKFYFDWTKLSLIGASTDGQKLPHTLCSRFKTIELEDYEREHLAQMFAIGLKQYTVDEEVVENFLYYTKDNPREISNLCRTIRDYLYSQGKVHLSMAEWNRIRNGLQLTPCGLDQISVRILQELKKHPQSSLTRLAAVLGLNPSAVRQKHELPLLKLNLISIKQASGRSLTPEGYRFVSQLKG